MPGNGIDKSLKTAVKKKMILLLQFSVYDNDGFLKYVLGVIGSAAVRNNEVVYGRIIFLIDIL